MTKWSRAIGWVAIVVVLTGTAMAQTGSRSVPTRVRMPDELLAGTPLALDRRVLAAVTRVEGSPVVLRELLSRALVESPDIRVSAVGPLISDAELEARRGAYGASFFLEGFVTQSNTPSSNILQGAQELDTDSYRFTVGLEQPVEATGGSVTLELQNDISETNSVFNLLSPEYRPNLALEIKQPLLRNLLIDRQRADIQLAAIHREVSDYDLGIRSRSMVASVEESYWELLYAVERVRSGRLVLELGKRILESDRSRFEAGRLARASLVDVEAQVAMLQYDLLQAQKDLITASDLLRRLVGLQPAATLLIPADPSDAPLEQVEDLDILLSRALSDREEVRAANAKVRSREVDVDYADNLLLPSLDLHAKLGLNGLSGSESDDFLGSDTDLGSSASDTLDAFEGNFGDSYSSMFSGDYYEWLIGLRLTVPLTNDFADHSYDAARLRLIGSKRERDRVVREVDLEVRRAHSAVRTDAALARTTRSVLAAAAENLKAEAERYNVGRSESDAVTRKLDEWSRALVLTIRASIEERIARARLDRAAGINLEKRGIRLPDRVNGPSSATVADGDASVPLPAVR